MKRRGFNMVEIILALAVLLVAFVYTFSAFSKSARHAVQSRNRKLAILTAQSLLEEVRAHEWGRPAPKQWPLDKEATVNYQFVVSKRPQKADFQIELHLETGALIGKVAEPSRERSARDQRGFVVGLAAMKRAFTVVELMTYGFLVSLLFAGVLACYKAFREYYAGAVGSYLISSEFEPGLRALRRELKETALVSVRSFPSEAVSSAREGLSFISARDWDKPSHMNLSPHGAPEWDKHVFYTLLDSGAVERWEKRIDPIVYVPSASLDLAQAVEGRHTKTMFKAMKSIKLSFLSYSDNGDEQLTAENPCLKPGPGQTRVLQVDLQGTNGANDSFWVHFRVFPRH